jgi:hypothetical protein
MLPNRSALFALAALTLPVGAQAQQVSAEITIASGPVAGRVIVGEPYRHPTYRQRPAYREVIVVRDHRGRGWYHNRRGYSQVRVYYDADRDCYYDRPYYRGLRAMVVYQNNGRYFFDGDRYDGHRDGYRGDNDRDDHRRGDRGRDEARNDYRRRVDDRRYHD